MRRLPTRNIWRRTILTDPIVRAVFGTLSPEGARGRLNILIFHRVLPKPDPLFPTEIDTVRFASIVDWLTRWFNVLPLQEAAKRLADGTLPGRAACITFDDGYADNETNALPILQRYGVTATFFISTGYLGGGRMWNDTIIEAVRRSEVATLDLHEIGVSSRPIGSILEKRVAIDHFISLIKYREHNEREDLAVLIADRCRCPVPKNLMMSGTSVKNLHNAGMEIGAHTVDHPILRLCGATEAQRQITESRDFLEGLIDCPVRLFAYPNGKPGIDYTPDQARLVERLGFLAAVSTEAGVSGTGDDLFQLRRFTPWDQGRHRFALRLALNSRGNAA